MESEKWYEKMPRKKSLCIFSKVKKEKNRNITIFLMNFFAQVYFEKYRLHHPSFSREQVIMIVRKK